MVTDAHGAKMSKSKGNVLNPIELIEEYGSDAVRIGLMTGTSAGNNQPFTVAKVVGGRNFCNKLWNIARYCETIIGDEFSRETPKAETLADHWIISRLETAQKSVDASMQSYRVGEALDTVYHFVWDEVADWYIESSKANPNKQLLAYVLTSVLKLAHPFAPFVTETIWQTLTWTGDSLLISELKPNIASYDAKRAEDFNELQTVVSEIRYITTVLEIHGASLYFNKSNLLKENSDLIKKLGKLHNCAEVDSGKGMHLTNTKLDCWLDIDIENAKRYAVKLRVLKLEREASIERLEARLNNKAYTDKAPAQVVQQTKDQLKEENHLLEKLNAELATFESFS